MNTAMVVIGTMKMTIGKKLLDKIHSLSFVGIKSGDGECFCWRGVQRGDKVVAIGQEAYDRDRAFEEDFRKEWAKDTHQKYDPAEVERAMEMLYPGELMDALGVVAGKRYRFTISAEEI